MGLSDFMAARARRVAAWSAMLSQINEAVGNDEYDLTAWETEFVASIESRLTTGYELSDGQDRILTGLWQKVSDNT